MEALRLRDPQIHRRGEVRLSLPRPRKTKRLRGGVEGGHQGEAGEVPVPLPPLPEGGDPARPPPPQRPLPLRMVPRRLQDLPHARVRRVQGAQQLPQEAGTLR
ncbi:serine/threonine-protein kinase Aurora-3 [Iris pallida]|uniref:Serine/threonine-protein kinase Aurora-3 n=1 Tax=Iris pallida TaxID=29817 RepID=A0AAX6HM49_IRIPA|nr:serine/threonine-protein kinase Aurora-3 [Iris pallida]KAJ6841644.1 serine/threonine-protein kinase Aurora-3 [Iris pallida]